MFNINDCFIVILIFLKTETEQFLNKNPKINFKKLKESLKKDKTISNGVRNKAREAINESKEISQILIIRKSRKTQKIAKNAVSNKRRQ